MLNKKDKIMFVRKNCKFTNNVAEVHIKIYLTVETWEDII